MKTAKHLKEEIDLMAKARKANEFNELVEYVEKCIKEQINLFANSSHNAIWIRPDDHKLGYYFDRIKPILEEAGYTIKKIQHKDIEKHWFCQDTVYVRDFIEIKWD